MEEINYKDEYEILKAKYSILENKYNIDVANLKRERDKSDDDYDIVVDKFNELADKFNLLCRESKTFEFESKKYRTLYIAAKNKLEINEIPFNEYALVQSLENEERSSIQAPPVATFQ